MRWLVLMLGLTVGTASAADLEVTIAEARSAEGRVMVALFDDAEAFGKMMEARRVAAAIVPIDGATARLTIGGLRPGRYAVSAIHDQNGNGRLDTNLLGLPTEGYGFSRDARGTMGPPSFDAAAFDLPAEGTRQTIKLGY